MRLGLSILTAAVATFSAGALLAADIALVVQNARYQSRAQIRDYGSRGNAHVAAYQAAGFEVIDIRETSAEALKEGLLEFERLSREADRVVIDFTGHTASNGETLFVLPVDAGSGSIVERYFDSASMDLLYNLVKHRPARSAVVVATPNRRAPGHVAAGPTIPQGVLVIAGPMPDVRRAVTTRLLTGSATNAVDNDAIWVGGFTSDMTLEAAIPVGTAAAQPPRPSTEQRQTNRAVLEEMGVWRSAAAAGTEAALRDYLTRYPNGIFTREAQARLEELVPAEQRIEASLNLTRTQRRNIQQQLTLLGFNTRGIDGIWGAGTRRAIADWQRREGIRSTGYMDGAQVRILAGQARSREAEIAAQREADAKAAEQADLDYWQRTGASGQEAGLQAYLERYPEGLFAPQAKRLLADIAAAKPKDDAFAEYAATERGLGLTPQMRTLAEQRLRAQGYDTGRVDGTFDEATRSALRKFQRANGLKVTGYMNRDTVGALIVSSFR